MAMQNKVGQRWLARVVPQMIHKCNFWRLKTGSSVDPVTNRRWTLLIAKSSSVSFRLSIRNVNGSEHRPESRAVKERKFRLVEL